MTPPRFQFTIRGLLWATFWVAVCAGAWTLALRYMIHSEDPVGLSILVAALAAGLFTPGLAIGAFFGKARTGFKINALILGLAAAALLAVAFVRTQL